MVLGEAGKEGENSGNNYDNNDNNNHNDNNNNDNHKTPLAEQVVVDKTFQGVWMREKGQQRLGWKPA